MTASAPALASAAIPSDRAADTLPAAQATALEERALSLFALYRLVAIAVIAISVLFAGGELRTQGVAGYVLTVLAAYFVAGIMLAFLTRTRLVYRAQVTAQVLTDVVAFALLGALAGGQRTGFVVLVFVSLAAGGLLARGRLAYFYAAVATTLLLAEHWLRAAVLDDPSSGDWMQAGLTSGAFFVVAWVAVAVGRYVTATERLAHERTLDLANLGQVNELLIREMRHGVLVVDIDGRIRHTNPQAEWLLGDVSSGSSLDALNAELAQSLAAWRKSAQAHPIWQVAGQRGTVNARFVAIEGVDPPAVAVYLEDDRKAREQAQQVKLAALGRLSASIAHEIRNPLSSIGHASDLLDDDAHRPESDKRLLKIIRENVHRVDRMIQDVLSIGRRDHVQATRIDAAHTLETFVANFATSERVDRAIMRIDVNDTRPFWFDAHHLDQILWNLTRNAVRFATRRPGSVRIRYGAGKRAGEAWLEVIDDGPGVAADARANLFEPFFTTDAKGTGLGLYMARELALANGAQLELVTESASGHFRLVVKPAA